MEKGFCYTDEFRQEEVFGPVLTVHRFAGALEAIALTNDAVFSLAAGLYTQGVSRAHRVARKVEAGMIFF